MQETCDKRGVVATPVCIHTYHGPMVVRSRRRGSLVEPRRVAFMLEAPAVDALAREARNLGVSKSALVQWLIQNIQRDTQGVPVGWAESHHNDKELPIDAP